MKRLYLIFFILLFHLVTYSQNATFITISSGGQFDRVTISANGCTSTSLNLCGNFTGSALSIALDGNILYIVDNKGFLYKNILTNTGTVGSCTKLGQFISKSTAIYGLTVGNGGIVYAASGSNIEFYDPVINAFGITGTLPNNWKIGGDLLFYKGLLYEAVSLLNGNNALVQVDLLNVSNSSLYINFNAGTNVFGFASVTVPCSNNAAYALSTTGSSTEIYAVDMINKTQATTATCTLPFKVNDAASIAETQSTSPPKNPVVTSPFNICEGSVVNFVMPTVGSAKDTLRWYTQAVGGISYGKPTPAISSSTLGNTNYYVSAFDTSTGCESERDTIVISVNSNPAVPTINIKDSIAICTGSSITLTSSATTNNQWDLNGASITAANGLNYITNIAGNYTVTTTTNKGCSKTSLPTKVIVADTINSTTNLAICTAFLPYNWNGLIFNAAGTQTKTGFKTIGGCDSSARLVLSIATAKNDTLNLFDCDSVYYKGVWYVYPTVIYDTLKACGGCDSVNLVVNVEVGMMKEVAYITNQTTNGLIDIIDVNSNTIIKTISLGFVGANSGITLSAMNQYIYISSSIGGVIYYDKLLNNSLLIGTGSAPNGIALDELNKKLFVANNMSNTVSVLNSNTVSAIKTVNNAGTLSPWFIELSKNDSLIYISSQIGVIHLVNWVNNSLVKTFNNFLGSPMSMCQNKNKSLLYAADYGGAIKIYNTISNTLLYNISSTKFTIHPDAICINKNEDKIYFTNGQDNTVGILNLLTNKIDTVINVGIAPVSISINKDNSKVLIVNRVSSSVSVLNTLTNSITTTISTNSILPTSYGKFIGYLKIRPSKDTLNFSSCTSITYKTKTYTSSTNFTDTTKSYRGCDSIYTLVNISITNNAAKDTLTHLKACNQLFYKNNTYTSSTIILDSILKTNNGICDSIYHYTQINITPTTTTKNTINLSNCKQVIYQGNTYTSSTTVSDTIKSYQGCDSIYNIVNILIAPSPTTITNNYKDCKQVIYKANTYATSTTVRDTLFATQGCDSVYNLANIIIAPSPITITNNYKDCKQVIYKSITYSSSTVVRDTVKSYQGCDSVYNVANISITPIATTTNSISFKHCRNIIYNGINYTNTITLKDTIKNASGCDSIYNTVNITITPITPTILTQYFSSCDSVTFKGNVYYNSTTIIDTVNSIGGCDSIYKQNIIHIFTKPTVSFTNSTVYVLANNPIVLKPIFSNAATFKWTPAIYLNNATTSYPVCTPLNDTTYKLQVTSDSGCVDYNYVRVLVAKTVKMPNVFSPNGDGINDKWDIEFINTYPQSTVQIFTRAGQLLYSSFAGSYKPWNGEYNGKKLPVGVYYYIIKLTRLLPPQTGSITILR